MGNVRSDLDDVIERWPQGLSEKLADAIIALIERTNAFADVSNRSGGVE